MKSKISKNKNAITDFPSMGETKWDNGDMIVVFFSSQRKGIVVYSTSTVCPLGCYSEAWDDEEFTPFKGTIQLSND